MIRSRMLGFIIQYSHARTQYTTVSYRVILEYKSYMSSKRSAFGTVLDNTWTKHLSTVIVLTASSPSLASCRSTRVLYCLNVRTQSRLIPANKEEFASVRRFHTLEKALQSQYAPDNYQIIPYILAFRAEIHHFGVDLPVFCMIETWMPEELFFSPLQLLESTE